jgi:FADH2-dependent halogenase
LTPSTASVARVLEADVIVIGGGPAGSSVAARLARLGRQVLLFEKERFPRFHIGESLLPCSVALFRELGVLPALERADFLPKYAAEFVTPDGSERQRYAFADGLVEGTPSAFEVDRSEFDRVLLEHARSEGARVFEEHQVVKFHADLADGVEVTVRDGAGAEMRARARMLVDASGQSALVASRLGLRQMEPELRNLAVFSHFEGAARASGPTEGDIGIVLAEAGWWWVIPLRHDRTSLGFVGPARSLGGQKPDETFLTQGLAAAPYLAERFAKARRVAPVRTISDWSYTSRALAGDRFLLVGDAGAFIDPVFSTGVHLGLTSALRAAAAIDDALRRGRLERASFVAYERGMRRLVATYTELVKGFYRPEFAALFLHPTDRFDLRRAVTSLLAGHGTDRFDIAWRVALFHQIVRANKHWSLVARLSERRAFRGPGSG